ncbi:MAG: immunoglobulin domain-containing protein, partial [Verrucomicrobiota bacterium]
AQYLANLASVGVTVFVSSGDGGSSPDSNGSSGYPATAANVESPASSPTVIAVGGTSVSLDIASGTVNSETVWSGSGGGVSTIFNRPSWQTGAGLPVGTTRAVPDVAAPADPITGALVILSGTQQQYGGTSWGAPTWAGFCALINQARANSGQVASGLLGPKIYPLLGTAGFRDVTSGNNGAYSAGTGYDLVTGLGAPNVGVLLQQLVNLPSILNQPESQSLIVGQDTSATFSVVASTGAMLNYQWQRAPAGSTIFSNISDSATYAGTGTATLTVSGVTSAMSGDQFQCVVSNSFGTLTSSPAALVLDIPLQITTFAGSAGISGSTDGTGATALFNTPGGIAADNAGNIYVADTNNHTVRKVTPAGSVTTLAGLAGVSGSTNGTGNAARFNFTSNLAVDSANNVYVADAGNNEIRKITPAGVVTTLAGRAGSRGAGSVNGTGSAARFNGPQGVGVDSAGNVYVADTSNNLIRKITPAGVVTTFAGATSSGSADGAGTAARFNFPVDVTVDGANNVYVADTNNATIRKITPDGMVTTLAGLAGATGNLDGVGSTARFTSPCGVRTDAAGNIFVADNEGNTIRKITPAGVVTTIAGLGGFSGSADGIGAAVRFNSPANALPDGSGHIYVIDTNNYTLRKGAFIAPPQITGPPKDQTAQAGQGAEFSVTASGVPTPAYRWQRAAAGSTVFANLADDASYAGSGTATLTVNGTAIAMNGDQFQCVVSNSYGSALTTPVTLAVNAPPHFTSATAATFVFGQTGSFNVTATGQPTPTFSASGLPPWASIDPTSGTLGGTPATSGNFSITLAASNAAGTDSQSFTLTVNMAFATWAAAMPLTGPDAQPSADPHHTGVPNLLAYAFGLNALSPDVELLPQVSLFADSNGPHAQITFTIPANLTDVIYAVEVSGDLAVWTPGHTYGPGFVNGAGLPTQEVSRTPNPDGSQVIVVRDISGAPGEARFIRVRVTPVP